MHISTIPVEMTTEVRLSNTPKFIVDTNAGGASQVFADDRI